MKIIIESYDNNGELDIRIGKYQYKYFDVGPYHYRQIARFLRWRNYKKLFPYLKKFKFERLN